MRRILNSLIIKATTPATASIRLRSDYQQFHHSSVSSDRIQPPSLDHRSVAEKQSLYLRNLEKRDLLRNNQNHPSKGNSSSSSRSSNGKFTKETFNDLVYLYNESKLLRSSLNRARTRHNELSRKIKQINSAQLMNPDSNGDDGRSEHLLREKGLSDGYRSEAIGLKGLIDELSKDLIRMERRLIESSLKLPNLTHPDVPIGPYQNSRIVSTSSVMLDGQQDESDLPFESFEEPFQKLPDPDRDHLGLMNDLNWISFPEGQRSTGPSFPVLIGGGAILELVLINYSISICLKSGYQLKILPELIRFGISERCGFNPRDQSSHQTYFVSTDIDPDHERIKAEGQKVEEEDLNRLCLSATAEIPMIGSYHSTTFPQPSSSSDSRVIKLVGLSNCFRSEAGSRGLNSRGLYRVHQFKKLELINLVKSDNIDESEERLKDLVKLQVEILRGLKLPYRVLEMSSEELGASAYHKFDIECWMPGRGKWGEVTSASNCTDYQSRRLSIKFKPTLTDEKTLKEGEPEENPGERLKEQEGEEQEGIGSKRNSNDNDRKKLKFVQTLNATAAAIPRLMISLIENGVILDDSPSKECTTCDDKVKKVFKLERDKEGLKPQDGAQSSTDEERLKRSRRVVGIRLPIVLKPFWNQLECDRDVNNGFIRWY